MAAAALHHDLIVATHNTRALRKAGVKVVDPFIS
jgi:predicted nucleic acid-binding protein